MVMVDRAISGFCPKRWLRHIGLVLLKQWWTKLCVMDEFAINFKHVRSHQPIGVRAGGRWKCLGGSTNIPSEALTLGKPSLYWFWITLGRPWPPCCPLPPGSAGPGCHFVFSKSEQNKPFKCENCRYKFDIIWNLCTKISCLINIVYVIIPTKRFDYFVLELAF